VRQLQDASFRPPEENGAIGGSLPATLHELEFRTVLIAEPDHISGANLHLVAGLNALELAGAFPFYPSTSLGGVFVCVLAELLVELDYCMLSGDAAVEDIF